MPEADTIHASGDRPVTREELVADLRALGVNGDRPVLVHSSLSRLGWVCGGAQTVLEALHQVLGSNATLVMPAFSGDMGEPSYWQDPPVPESWWPVIRESMPAFDPARSPLRMMGAIANVFRAWPGVYRSDHPHDSFCACGPKTRSILRPQPLADGFGEDSPLARLYEEDARVLLLGVTHANNTSLHLAEHRAEWSGKRMVESGAPVMRDGQRVWEEFESLLCVDSDFARIGEEFGDRQARGKMGRGEARWMSQREIVDYGAAWMSEHRPESLKSPAVAG
jgi:aminoglycoside 3-N-acetyltransferase